MGTAQIRWRRRRRTGLLTAMHGLAPRDEAEALLCVQMLATHEAAIEFLRRTRQAEYLPQRQSHGGLAVKLLRTYALQLEALQRYRGKAQQKVKIEHVHVHQGGQAIVGHVETGAGPGTGASSKTEEHCHVQQLAHAPEPTLRGADAARDAMPVAGRERAGSLSISRRR